MNLRQHPFLRANVKIGASIALECILLRLISLFRPKGMSVGIDSATYESSLNYFSNHSRLGLLDHKSCAGCWNVGTGSKLVCFATRTPSTICRSIRSHFCAIGHASRSRTIRQHAAASPFAKFSVGFDCCSTTQWGAHASVGSPPRKRIATAEQQGYVD